MFNADDTTDDAAKRALKAKKRQELKEQLEKAKKQGLLDQQSYRAM